MAFTIGPTITCLDDIAGMRRPHGRLVMKAVCPHLINKVVFSAKIKEISSEKSIKIPENSNKIAKIYAQSWGTLITVVLQVFTGLLTARLSFIISILN